MLSSNEIQIIVKRLDLFEEKTNQKFEIILERLNILQEILLDTIHRMDKHEKENKIFFKEIDKRTKALEVKWKEIDNKFIVLESRINSGGKGLLSIP